MAKKKNSGSLTNRKYKLAIAVLIISTVLFVIPAMINPLIPILTIYLHIPAIKFVLLSSGEWVTIIITTLTSYMGVNVAEKYFTPTRDSITEEEIAAMKIRP